MRVTTAKPQILKEVSDLLTAGDTTAAAEALTSRYPFVRPDSVTRRYGDVAALRVFIRDGFLDRYSGEPLVFPGALRLLSALLPEQFPYHPNWKTSETHPAYWDLSATIDHIVPVARGGPDEAENWVTTSMLRNAAKANWTLEELGWTLHPPQPRADWDGLLSWFISYVATHPEVLDVPRIRAWSKAAAGVATR